MKPWLDKRGRLVCWCGGYWFPHRKGGGACDHSKTCGIHRAKRTGDPEAIFEAMLEFRLKYPSADDDTIVSAECPF